MLSEENSNHSAVCAAVRLDIESVRDGRASDAERTFVMTHIAHCSSCASEWAFARSTKAAWQQMPTAYPPASLSARIAAATYRKPTFAQRLVASFAFLTPLPVRVAVGVAAVAGIAFLAMPRQGMIIAQNSVAQPEAKPETVVATVKPVAKKVKPAETVTAPVVAVVKPTPKTAKPVVVAMKPVAPTPAKIVAAVTPVVKSVPEPVAVVAPVKVKKAPTQVAVAVVASKFTPAKPSPVKPAVIAPSAAAVVAPQTVAPPIAPDETAPMVAAIEKPAMKEPTASHAAPIAGVTVGERESSNGFIRLGSQLANAGRSRSGLFRGSAIVATNSPAIGIVSAPIK